jgi:cytochrome c biogenesis protein CcdA/glutaredoxin
MKKISLFIFVIFALFSLFSFGKVQAKSDFTCAVYFSGVGCPHCAKTDPLIFEKLLKNHPDLVIIEYEIYQQKENSSILDKYCQANNLPYYKRGIPLIFLGKDYLVGDRSILENAKKKIEENQGARCLLVNGSEKRFEDLNLAKLLGRPKIWHKDKILIKGKQKEDWIFGWNGEKVAPKNQEEINSSSVLSKLIKEDNIKGVLKEISYKSQGPIEVDLSGKKISFENSIKLRVESKPKPTESNLTFAKILSLAAVDAINPCALAVLILMLTGIIAYNPKKRKNILLAGGAFIISVFVMYFLYGLIIVKFFQLIQALTPLRIYLYKILGGVALILGILNIRDFLSYKPGRIGTEMPLFLRPKVKKIISKITSPKGAFLLGAFVTFFLLPCTIGPYVIAGGILSALELLKTFPWLLLYNLVFVLPMIVIVGLVYFGFRKVEDVSSWKEKNIKYLHLLAGIIITLLGIIMVLGLM